MTKEGESTMQKVKDALHLGGNKDHSTTTTGTTSTHVPGATSHQTHGHAEGSHGPHGSSALNAADPRVDSDLDGNRLPNKTSSGYGTQDAYGTGVTGSTGTTHSTNAGPHHSNIANAADPRIDSDMSNTGNRHGTTTGHSAIPGSGSHATHGSGISHSTNAGPHQSNIANAADPRIDSDLSNTGNRHGASTGHSAIPGSGISHSTNAGPHNSNTANAADPRIDSNLSNTGNRHGASTGHSAFPVSGSHATPGSGTAQKTAGPHNSDLLNKADPRVDADLDGSTTIGGNKTYH